MKNRAKLNADRSSNCDCLSFNYPPRTLQKHWQARGNFI